MLLLFKQWHENWLFPYAISLQVNHFRVATSTKEKPVRLPAGTAQTVPNNDGS